MTATFLNDVAAMQIDMAVAAINDGGYQGLADASVELVSYARNIRERRELVQNYYFALALAKILALNTEDRADTFNLFVKSHGIYNIEVEW